MAEPITQLTPAPIIGVTAPTPLSVGFPSPPQFDPVEILPPAAAEKLRLLRQRREDRHRLVPEFEQIREASMARVATEQALRRLVDHPQDGGFGLDPDDRRVLVATETVAKATDNFRRMQELQTIRSAQFQTASAALANTELYLRSGRPGNTALEVFEAPEPQLRKGEDLLAGVERARHRGRELRADLARVEAAAYPAADARAVAMAQIEALYERGALDTSGCVEHLEPFRFPTKQVRAAVHNSNSPGAVVFAEVIDAGAVIAHLLHPQLVAAVEASIAADADEPNALSQADREKRAAVIAQDLLICEREEASLTWRAQSEGLPVEFRADISPLALLGLKLVTTPRADALPETSPGFSWTMRR